MYCLCFLGSPQLAGILFDTNNLSNTCSIRDSQAVQLLLFGTSEHMRHEYSNNFKHQVHPKMLRSPIQVLTRRLPIVLLYIDNQRPAHGSGGNALRP
ncbi:hypothetical protein GUJ93_ZPchr0001g30582 [Zizania palustris]|uniref:Uncharacterized protein n=1 Tax=Zizania palustris TaxID=103762 RepID=A0A8J5RVK8_ZIZPA|nr:hypothetical protein GUJ93_ZPchr0001g30582 [Zizania palustris]